MSGCAGGLVAISNLKSGLVIRVVTDHRGAPITDLQAAPKLIQVSMRLKSQLRTGLEHQPEMVMGDYSMALTVCS